MTKLTDILCQFAIMFLFQNHIHVMVPVRAAQHHEVRAFHQETRLSAALRCLESGVVHIPASGRHRIHSGQCDVAMQTAIGHNELGRLFGILCDDWFTVAQSFWTVSSVGRNTLWW